MRSSFGAIVSVLFACACGGGSTPASPSPAPIATPPPSPVSPPAAPPPVTRVTVDRRDDAGGPQVKVMYVLPSDVSDKQLDQTGSINTTVESWTRWVERATDGQRVKLDTFEGAIDIAFLRLPRTDADIASYGITAVNEIQNGLRAAGFDNPEKIYAVYYGGNNLLHCGQSVRSGGQAIAAAFIEATPPAFAPCPQQTIPDNRTPGLTRIVDSPGYWEFTMAHEVFHMLGAVPSCAPHVSASVHVNDSPIDLMGVFTIPGVEPTDPRVRWNPSVIDVNRDDYFGHGRSCTDVARSPYLSAR